MESISFFGMLSAVSWAMQPSSDHAARPLSFVINPRGSAAMWSRFQNIAFFLGNNPRDINVRVQSLLKAGDAPLPTTTTTTTTTTRASWPTVLHLQ